MSSSKPAAQTTTIQNRDPWGPQQPYLTTGFERAQADILEKPITQFPASTVVPFAPQTEAGLGAAEALAAGGNPLVDAATQQLTGTLQGDYLNANPFFDAAVSAATRPLVEQYQESILPGIQAGFSGRGRYGSGLQAFQQQRAGEGLGRQIGDISSAMAYKNYQDERARMAAGISAAPAMRQAAYMDPAELERIGGVREGLAGAELQDAISKFMQPQTAAQDAISNYMRLVSGGQYGGQTTAQQPIYRDKFGEGLGAAASIAGIAGNLFGAQGAFPMSDRRLKTNIKPIGEINSLKWYEFDYIWGGPRQIGVMAQEVLKIIPEAVFKIGRWLAVDYSKLGVR